MLPPLPRCSGWASSSLIAPSRVSLPRKGRRVGLHIVLFEACSASTRVAACTLARSPYFVTRYPKASDISSPPCLLRLLPAGANRRVEHAPTGKRRLVTAHPRCSHCQANGYETALPVGTSRPRGSRLLSLAHLREFRPWLISACSCWWSGIVSSLLPRRGYGLLRCPLCRLELIAAAGVLACRNRHSFDLAREGYVNL